MNASTDHRDPFPSAIDRASSRLPSRQSLFFLDRPSWRPETSLKRVQERHPWQLPSILQASKRRHACTVLESDCHCHRREGSSVLAQIAHKDALLRSLDSSPVNLRIPAALLALTFAQLHQLHTRVKRTTNMRSVCYAALLCYVALTGMVRSEPVRVRKLATSTKASDGSTTNLELSKRLVAARQFKYPSTSKGQRKRAFRDDPPNDSCPA
jgi:hypothetical protein